MTITQRIRRWWTRWNAMIEHDRRIAAIERRREAQHAIADGCR